MKILLLLVGSLIGHAAGFPEIQDWSSLRLKVMQGGCLGPCPAYTVEVSGSGEVRYEGHYNVLIRGVRTMQIGRAEVEALVAEFRRADFFYLLEQSSSPNEEGVIAISASVDGLSKIVRRPTIPLGRILEAMDRLVIQWTMGNPPASPPLTTLP